MYLSFFLLVWFFTVKESQTLWNCLQNKTIFLLGDSTLRNWYKFYIMPTFNCTPVTESWNNDKWHKPAMCENKKLGLSVGWFPHSQPFAAANYDENRYVLYSISRRIDDISADTDGFIVIHLYSHILSLHHDEFWTKMKIIRNSVAKLFERNSKAKVFIKSPHTFIETASMSVRMSDFYAYVYINILYDLFRGLHGRVTFLNHMDASDAIHNGLHPKDPVRSSMVLQMLSFAC